MANTDFPSGKVILRITFLHSLLHDSQGSKFILEYILLLKQSLGPIQIKLLFWFKGADTEAHRID